MTLVTGTVQDLGYDGMEGTLWARPARFRSDGQIVYAPERKPYKVVDGVVSADLAPGPAVLELQVGSHARGTFEVVIPEEDISLADLLDTVFPWEPTQVSLFVAEREAAEQAKTEAEAAAGQAVTAADTATTAAQQTGQDRSHVDQVRTELDEAFDESTAGNVLPPRLTETALNATYGTKAELAEKVDTPAGIADGQVPTWDAEDGQWVAGDGGADDAVTSIQIRNFVASSDPNEPLNPGDFQFVYVPPFTDFNPFQSMAGLTPRWVGGDWAIVDDPTATDGKAIQLSGATGRRLLSIDSVDSDPARGDAEIVAKVKVSSVTTSLGGAVVLRGSGEAGHETGWAASIYSQHIQLGLLDNGSFLGVDRAPFPYEANTWYWMRFRAHGPLLRLRIWADGEPEPVGWHVERESFAGPGAGWIGLYGSANITHTWDAVGVGLDGATAPKVAP